MEFQDVNWLAVVAGTIVAFLLGWLIYSPALFGKRWAEGSGVDLDEGTKPPIFAMLAQLTGLLCVSVVVGVTATINALFTALLAILAVAILVISNGAFCKKSRFALAVDFGYLLLAGIVMIAVQGIL